MESLKNVEELSTGHLLAVHETIMIEVAKRLARAEHEEDDLPSTNVWNLPDVTS